MLYIWVGLAYFTWCVSAAVLLGLISDLHCYATYLSAPKACVAGWLRNTSNIWVSLIMLVLDHILLVNYLYAHFHIMPDAPSYSGYRSQYLAISN